MYELYLKLTLKKYSNLLIIIVILSTGYIYLRLQAPWSDFDNDGLTRKLELSLRNATIIQGLNDVFDFYFRSLFQVIQCVDQPELLKTAQVGNHDPCLFQGSVI